MRKMFFILFLMSFLCVNFSFWDTSLMQVRGQNWVTIASTLISSYLSSGPTNSVVIFQQETRVGEKNCDIEIYHYYKVENKVLPDGTCYKDTNFVGKSIYACENWKEFPPIDYSFRILADKKERTGFNEVKCATYAIGLCQPRTLTCKDTHYDCP